MNSEKESYEMKQKREDIKACAIVWAVISFVPAAAAVLQANMDGVRGLFPSIWFACFVLWGILTACTTLSILSDTSIYSTYYKVKADSIYGDMEVKDEVEVVEKPKDTNAYERMLEQQVAAYMKELTPVDTVGKVIEEQ